MTASAPTAIPVAIKDVEGALTRRLLQLRGPGDAPVQRARMANLVIFCSSVEQAEQINGQLAEVIMHHPARVLLLIGEPGPKEKPLTCTITVRPIRDGGPEQAFSDQVTLHAGGASVEQLPFAVRSLLIGDLPTNLWWAAPVPPPFAGPLLYDLAEGTQQIMYDSLGWPDPAKGVSAMAWWLEQIEQPAPGGRWRVASDLNWRRLKYWRRMLMQGLEPPAVPGGAHSPSEILVEHGPHAVVQAWELASWLSTRLGWEVQTGKVQPGSEMAWRFLCDQTETLVRVRRLDQGPPEIRHVRIACLLGDKPGAIHLTLADEQRLATTLEGVESQPRTMTLPPHPPSEELIGRQLSDRERDPVFRESMVVAQTMAQCLLQ